MFWFVILGILVGAGFGLSQSTNRWQSALSGLVIALASAAVGGLIGLLFGVPKRIVPAVVTPAPALPSPGPPPPTGEVPPITTPVADTHLAYGGNTNLEQVSDWLTKILLGAGLTQIVRLPSAFEHLGSFLSPSLSTGDASVFATALVVFNLLAGFFYGFLGARILLPRALTDAETKVAHARAQLLDLDAAPTSTGIGPRKYTTREDARRNAVQLYRRVEQLERHTPGISFSTDEYRRLVQRLVRVKLPITALNLLRLAMRYYPDDPSLPVAAGVIYGRELERYEEAEACYFDALRLSPDSAVAIYDLACNYARRWYRTQSSTTSNDQNMALLYYSQAWLLLARINAVAKRKTVPPGTQLVESYNDVLAQACTDSIWTEVGLRALLRSHHLLP